MSSTENTIKTGKRSIKVVVRELSSANPVMNAQIYLYAASAELCGYTEPEYWQAQQVRAQGRTDKLGELSFDKLAPGQYVLIYAHLPPMPPCVVKLGAKKDESVEFKPDFNVIINTELCDAKGRTQTGPAQVGQTLLIHPEFHYSAKVGISSKNQTLNQYQKGHFETRLSKAGPVTHEFILNLPRIFTPNAAGTIQAAQAAQASSTAKAAQPAQTALPESVNGQPEGTGQDAFFIVNKEVMIMDVSDECTQTVGVKLGRSHSSATDDTAFWSKIRTSTEALSFDNYKGFIDFLISRDAKGTGSSSPYDAAAKKADALNPLRNISFTNGEAYRLLKVATEAFVMVNTGVSGEYKLSDAEKKHLRLRDINVPGETSVPGGSAFERYIDEADMLPYLAIIQQKMPEVKLLNRADAKNDYDLHLNYQLIQEKLRYPCMLELIWSYWHEEGMLVQTMNAITRRFQNVRSPHGNDPLANLEIDPLRPLNNVIWGYTQDEQNRLTVVRRNYEYDHHYGLRLEGRAVQNFRPVDTRSKFLEAFHHLLRMCSMFYKQDDDTTVKADAFPVLNALKEVHLVLSQGAHNQYGDLPSSARIEMLMQQWMLARPEFRDFLPTRMMVAYPEPWMDRVDAMKKLQGWTDTSVIHFRSLAMFGEQLLLSVRFGAWSDVYEPSQAFNWARFWRPQAQGYIHAYRAVTGVDLTGTAVDTIVDATMPSVLLQRRLHAQQQRSA
jgi:hypothetical protein